MNILKALIRKIKRYYSPIIMSRNADYSSYEIGEGTYGKPEVISYGDGTALRIGRFCSLSDDVIILLGGEHNVDWVTTYPFNKLLPSASHYPGHPKTKGDVVIGNDVWIGRGALILSGVTIANGAVIGAHSVVTKDVPHFSITAGNPARHIRYRFSEETIQSLERMAWWDWPLKRPNKQCRCYYRAGSMSSLTNIKPRTGKQMMHDRKSSMKENPTITIPVAGTTCWTRFRRV